VATFRGTLPLAAPAGGLSLAKATDKTNSRAQKKDHENNKTKYEIGAPEPNRTIGHGRKTKD